MATESGIILKFFSGPHLGAELPLLSGRTVVGSADSCDLIIGDSTVPGRHFVIHVPEHDPSAVTIEPLDGTISLVVKEAPETREQAGEEPGPEPDREETTEAPARPRKISQKADWPPCVLLMAGTTGMAWKNKEDDWQDLATEAIFTPRDASGESSAKVPDKDKPLVTIGKWSGRLLKALGILILFAFIFGPCMGGKSTWDARNMKKLLKKNEFNTLTVQQTDIGVVISGKVKTREQRKKLWRLAGGAAYPVFIDVAVEEERTYAVKVALSVRGLFPRVELDGNDILMKGYMRDKLIEGASKVWVHQDIPDARALKSTMVYASQVWPVLRNRLIVHKLAELVVVRFHPGLVQIEGELDFDQRETLETVKGEVCDSLKSPIAFWDTLTAPGFSEEWNRSINASMHSKYSPDPGLSQLYLDSRSAKGLSALPAATPALKAKGDVANTISGQPSSGKPGQDKPDQSVPMVAARDAQGNIVYDEDGNPLMVPALLDKDGNVIRDKDGNPVSPVVVTDKDGRAARNKDGMIILDEDANARLRKQYGGQGTAPDGETAGAKGPAGEDAGATVGDDTALFGSGTSFGETLDPGPKEDPLGGLTVMGVTMTPIPFVSMTDGQKFFTGGQAAQRICDHENQDPGPDPGQERQNHNLQHEAGRMSIEASAGELLENDGSAFGRATLLKEIDTMAFRVKKKLDQGVAPGEARAMDDIRTAIESAGKIVDQVWTLNNE